MKKSLVTLPAFLLLAACMTGNMKGVTSDGKPIFSITSKTLFQIHTTRPLMVRVLKEKLYQSMTALLLEPRLVRLTILTAQLSVIHLVQAFHLVANLKPS